MTMHKRLLLVVLSTVLIFVRVQPAEADPVISVGAYSPTSPTFSVPIEITGAADLMTWQFDLAFNPSDLQAISVSEGPFISGGGQFLTLFVPGVIDNSSGLISLIAGGYLDLPPGPSGNGTLATVEFSVLGTGNSPVRVNNASVFQGDIPSPVPEPHTLPLLLSVLALLGVRQRARRQMAGSNNHANR
jgi:hypothetical protein